MQAGKHILSQSLRCELANSRIKTHQDHEAESGWWESHSNSKPNQEEFPCDGRFGFFLRSPANVTLFQNSLPFFLSLAFLRQRVLNTRTSTGLLMGTNIPMNEEIGWHGEKRKKPQTCILASTCLYDFYLYHLLFRGLNKQGYKCRRKLSFVFLLYHFLHYFIVQLIL